METIQVFLSGLTEKEDVEYIYIYICVCMYIYIYIHTHTHICYSAMRKKKILSFVTMWIGLEGIVLVKISLKRKRKTNTT